MTDTYSQQGDYELCWRTNTDDKFTAILAMRPGWDHWKFVGKWALGPIPIAEIESALRSME